MKVLSILIAATIFIAACGEQETTPTGSDNHTGGGAAAPQSEATVDSLGSQLGPGSMSADTSSGSSDTTTSSR